MLWVISSSVHYTYIYLIMNSLFSFFIPPFIFWDGGQRSFYYIGTRLLIPPFLFLKLFLKCKMNVRAPPSGCLKATSMVFTKMPWTDVMSRVLWDINYGGWIQAGCHLKLPLLAFPPCTFKLVLDSVGLIFDYWFKLWIIKHWIICFSNIYFYLLSVSLTTVLSEQHVDHLLAKR